METGLGEAEGAALVVVPLRPFLVLLHAPLPKEQVVPVLEARVPVGKVVAIDLVHLPRLAPVLLDRLEKVTQEVADWKRAKASASPPL